MQYSRTCQTVLISRQPHIGRVLQLWPLVGARKGDSRCSRHPKPRQVITD
jgi:hypothetical protein